KLKTQNSKLSFTIHRLPQLMHGFEEGGSVDGSVVGLAAELAVGALDVEDEAFGLGPFGVGAEVDAAGGDAGRRLGFEQALRFGAYGGEIGFHLAWSFDAAYRAVTRHDEVGLQTDDRVQGRRPPRERPFPTDRRAQPEEDVAGEQHALLGKEDDDVAGGVG